MIEVGVFDTGSLDMPFKKTGNGVRVMDGSLADIHAHTQDMMKSAVRRCVLADKLGYDIFWLVEHHFNIEGAEISPSPLQVQAAAAALTNRVRLGQLANIITWWHPLRLAEQIAVLDVLSGGRVEAGISRGYQPRETEVFGYAYGSTTQDQEKNRSFFDEAFTLLKKAWTEDSFSFRGEFFSVPPTWAKWNHAQTIAALGEPGFGRTVDDVLDIGRPDLYSGGMPVVATTTRLKELSVLPHPIQKPYPPLWEGVTSDRSLRWAAQNGINGNFFYESALKIRQKVEIYMEEAAKHNWPDRVSPGVEWKAGWDGERRRGLIASRVIHVQEGSVGNLDRAGESEMFLWDFYGPFGFAGILGDPGKPFDPNTPVTPELLRERDVIFQGSKQQVLESILRLHQDAYLGQDMCLNLRFESGGMSHEEVEEQMWFFAEEILPELRRECGGGPEHPVVTTTDELKPLLSERPQPATA
jgi:alkanesulfonate monooxygenase SsuD/methylene tetrahydromethanopterin reductase-like flavin-dependent oxidoreductase (luciferase family)